MHTATMQAIAAALCLAVVSPGSQAGTAMSWTSALNQGDLPEIVTPAGDSSGGNAFTLLRFDSPEALQGFVLLAAEREVDASAAFYVAPNKFTLPETDCVQGCESQWKGGHPLNLGFQKVVLRQLDPNRPGSSGILDTHSQGRYLAMPGDVGSFRTALAATANPTPGTAALLGIGAVVMVAAARIRKPGKRREAAT